MRNEETLFAYQIENQRELSVSDLHGLVDEVWAELSQANSESREAAAAAGIDLTTLPSTADELFEVRAESGIDAISLTVLVVAIIESPATKRIASDLWKYVVLPRIRRRWGDLALKDADKAQLSKAPKSKPKK